MKSLRIILIAALLVFIGSAVWGEKPKNPRFFPATYKMTAKIQLKDEYRMYDSAVAILEEGLLFYPDDAEMHFLLGKAYYHKSNYRGMAEQLSIADSLKGKKDKWLKELNRMRDEKWPQIFNQGVTAYKEQDYDTALDLFLTCTILNPSDARGYWLFGDTYRLTGRYEEAFTTLDAALKLDPDDPRIWRSYAEALFHSGRQKEALKSYNKVLEKKPEDTEVLFKVATIHYNAGDYDQALSYYQKIIEADSTYKDGYFNIGEIYYRQKFIKTSMALDSLKDDSGEYLKDEESTVRIEGLIQKKDEFLASAQIAYEKVVELDTIDMEAQVYLAEVYQEQENFDQAMGILEPLIQKDSTNCSALEQLAIIYAKIGMGEKAKATWQKAQDCLESQK